MKNQFENETPLLEIKNLKKLYPVKGGIIKHTIGNVHAVDGVDLTIQKGETLGLVGESGCGKSTIGRIMVSLEKPTEGTVIYKGQDLATLSTEALREIRTQKQLVFQDSYSSLNPRKHVFEILAKPMVYHGLVSKREALKAVDRLLDLVGLPANSKGRYAHEFSGGQRQRISIAKALSLNPELIVCDEPVSALDVSIQAQILNLLKDLQKELGLTYLFIGHGLGAVNYISNRIAVMYLGKIVEIADAKTLFSHAVHPYTKAICDAVPVPDPQRRGEKGALLQGEIGSNLYPPSGCRFHPRCRYSTPECSQKEQTLLPVSGDNSHLVACSVMLKELGGQAND